MTPKPLVRFSPNLARSFVLTPPRHRTGRSRHFPKCKMATDEKLKFTKNCINSKRFVRFEPNFVFSINSALGTRLLSHNHENRNPRWPIAAILKFKFFNKTNINVKKSTTDVVLKVGRMEIVRVAREKVGIWGQSPLLSSCRYVSS